MIKAARQRLNKQQEQKRHKRDIKKITAEISFKAAVLVTIGWISYHSLTSVFKNPDWQRDYQVLAEHPDPRFQMPQVKFAFKETSIEIEKSEMLVLNEPISSEHAARSPSQKASAENKLFIFSSGILLNCFIIGLVYYFLNQKNIKLKRKEEELQQTKEQLRLLEEAIPQQLWTTQSDGGLNYVNQHILDYSRRTKEEIILQESQTRLKLINTISTEITSEMSVEQVIESTVRQMSEYFDTLRVAYSTIDPQGYLTVLHSIEPGAMAQIKGFKSNLTQAPEYLNALRKGDRIIVEDIAQDSRLKPLVKEKFHSDTKAILNVPLQHSEQLVGLLCFESPEPRNWSAHEIVTLTEVADYLSLAIKEASAQQERLRIEVALRESEERYRDLIETMAEGIVLQDADGSICTCNLAAQRIIGRSSEQMIRRTSSDLSLHTIHEDGSPFPSESYPSIVTLSTGKSQSNVVMGIYRADETLIWISINTRPLFRPNETTPYAVVSSFLDITDRKITEEELRLSDEVLKQMPDAILLTDLEGKIQKWMGKSEQIFGYTASEAIGKPINFLHRPDIKQVIIAQILKEVKEADVFVGEIPCLSKDGSEVPIETTAKTFYDKAGKPLFLIGINRDITERKRSEEELRQANKKLIAWVSELEQLGEMSDVLQACLTVEEAYSAIANLVQPLFPDVSGAIFVISESRNMVEAVATWGADLASQNMFVPNACWGLRRGRLHLLEQKQSGLRCKHLNRNPAPEESLCVPMLAQGEALGLVYLSSTQLGQLTEAKQQLAVNVAEHIGLALANLKLRETLQNQSIRDPLTGLFNRRYMEESLARELNRVQREQQSMGIIMLDVDHFKGFNDTYGHEAGDEVLREVGLFLQKQIREADIACRYGGEEFLLILPDTSLEVTQERAEQVRQGIKQLNVQHRHQSLGTITFSLGVACFPEHGLSSEAVIHAADTALYRAKAEGRDRVVVSNSETPILQTPSLPCKTWLGLGN